MSFEKRSPKLLINFYFKLSVFLNILTIVFGIAYFVIPLHSNFYSLVGLVIVGSWLMNIFLLFIENQYVNKSSDIGKKITHNSYLFIILFILLVLLIVIDIFLQNAFILNVVLSFTVNLFILLGISLISLTGILFAVSLSSTLDLKGVWNFD